MWNHSHKKRNSLDTRAVFTEFLKYVENSGVVVYRGDGSFQMASKSEELLAGDDTEGILASSLQLQFPKYRILIQRAIFYAQIAKKHIKQKGD